jgi:hypothetical protein
MPHAVRHAVHGTEVYVIALAVAWVIVMVLRFVAFRREAQALEDARAMLREDDDDA